MDQYISKVFNQIGSKLQQMTERWVHRAAETLLEEKYYSLLFDVGSDGSHMFSVKPVTQVTFMGVPRQPGT